MGDWLDHQEDDGCWLWLRVTPPHRNARIFCLALSLTLALALLALATRASPAEWLPGLGFGLLQLARALRNPVRRS